MSNNVAFAATPKLSIAQISVLNAGRDGTGTVVDAFTAGASGSRVERSRIQAIATTTAGMVRLYAYDGANTRLVAEIPVSAIVPSATVQAFSTIWEWNGLVLPTGYKIRASTEKGETFNIVTEGGDF